MLDACFVVVSQSQAAKKCANGEGQAVVTLLALSEELLLLLYSLFVHIVFPCIRQLALFFSLSLFLSHKLLSLVMRFQNLRPEAYVGHITV